jgi:hypothetical protein
MSDLPVVILNPEHVRYTAVKIAVLDCNGTRRMAIDIARMGIPPVNQRRTQSIRLLMALISSRALFKVETGREVAMLTSQF